MSRDKNIIYIASNKYAMSDGWHKVGISDRGAEERVRDTPQTTHKEKYTLQYYRSTPLYKKLEKHIHDHFENDREWVKASIAEIVAEMDKYESDLLEGKTERAVHEPREHQVEAIKSVCKHFENGANRATLIMPTGSGKTFTSLKIVESINAQNVLFLAPSLQLIRQTKNEWINQSKDPFKWMGVCSAKDVEEKNAALEMQGIVSTDPLVIRDFRKHNSTRNIIFCTYQSLPSIKQSSLGFDIIICDEAHRTAGLSKHEDGLFQLVHSDNNIKSKRRLYQTATPKVFKEDLLDLIDGQDDVIAYDMKNENIFGPIVYEMTLGEAIEKKMLCDYRILAVGVNDKEIERVLSERTYVENGFSADEVAAHLALIKAMESSKSNHAISFHSRLKLADYTSDMLNANGIFSQTVKGSMSTRQREKIFKNFVKKPLAVLTSSQALQEGVDIRKVDSIFFSSPKASTISIVQACGRSFRLDPENKNKVATIIIPVYTVGDQNINIEKSSFKGLYQLITTMCETDYRLRSYVEGIIEGKGERGKRGEIDYIKLEDFERLDFIGFTDKLKKSFILQTLKKRKNWEEYYTDYIRSRLTDSSKKYWVNLQRKLYKKNELTARQVMLLESISDWVWDSKFNDWLKTFQLLKSGEKSKKTKDFKWYCRKKYREGTLDRRRIKLMESIEGWDWATDVGTASLEEAIEVAKSRGGECLSTEYVNSSTDMLWRCSEGHEWRAIYSSIKHRSWCPHCAPTSKITIDQIRKIAKSKKGVLLSKGITNGKEKLEFKCDKNHLFERTGVEIKANKWCQKCNIISRTKLKSKSVVLISTTGEVTNYESISEAGRAKNLSVSSIKRAIEKKTGAKGYRCVLEDEYYDGWIKDNPYIKKNAKRTVVIQMDDDNILIKEWPSISAAAKYFEINSSTLSEAISKGTRAKGFKWKKK